MVIQEIKQDADAKDDRIKELTEENELLFEQLHVVQEELEKYYYKLKDCEQGKDSGAGGDESVVVISPKAKEAITENMKLRALVAQQQIALQVERTNSLAARLGEMLIKGVSSAGSFIALPVRLRRMWKALDQTEPPAALGGASFQKVLDTYAADGIEAVEKLLDSVFLSPVMRANAYTALARQVMLTDALQGAELARMAWKTDPRPYRLKWLAFRLHEADDAINAEVLLDMLPADINMSDSEKRHANRLRQEAKRERSRQAQKALEDFRAESTQLQAAMTKLRATAAESNNRQKVLTTQMNKQREDHKLALMQRDNRIAELKKAADLARQEIERARDAFTAQMNKQHEDHKLALMQRDNRIAELKKAAEQARQETNRARETQVVLQHEMEKQKKESDVLAMRTALMLKNILTHFESDTSLLSQVMRIVMGTEANK